MSCNYHPERDAIDRCSACGKAVCRECNVTGTPPLCRRCWDLLVTNVQSGIRIKSPETQETPATQIELPAQEAKPIAKEPKTFAETPMQGIPARQVEQPRQTMPPTHAKPIIQQPVAPAPQVPQAERKMQAPLDIGKPPIMRQELTTKEPRPGIGTRALALFGALFKPKPGTGGKKKRQEEAQLPLQITRKTFQCHQCGSENIIGELFCKVCGAWFQYSCPSCGAIVDPKFDFCPRCSSELGWSSFEDEY